MSKLLETVAEIADGKQLLIHTKSQRANIVYGMLRAAVILNLDEQRPIELIWQKLCDDVNSELLEKIA